VKAHEAIIDKVVKNPVVSVSGLYIFKGLKDKIAKRINPKVGKLGGRALGYIEVGMGLGAAYLSYKAWGACVDREEYYANLYRYA
jgi:hypothetical protein